ncbi:MAG: hypothetical protein JWM25_771 [Thermoleophilia bacterium]|nr:hypothetical protein [Thermoleophilia bacterium]
MMQIRRASDSVDTMRCMGARLLVYTAHGCCLCDEARAELDVLAPELGLTVEWIHIDGIAELEATWREQLPAGVLDGRKVFKYRVDADLLRRRVAASARN